MLGYAMLGYAMLGYAMLGYAMLGYAMPDWIDSVMVELLADSWQNHAGSAENYAPAAEQVDYPYLHPAELCLAYAA
jgi:hypothetical protein